MPRKRLADQQGRFRATSKRRNQWPTTSIWGSGSNGELAVENWLAKRTCDGACEACVSHRRVRGTRALYGRRRH